MAADVLGAGVVAGLLEAEGVHAEQVAVARHFLVPVRQRLRNAVAQQDRVAEVEVDGVRGLDRDEVARVLDRDRAIAVRRQLEAALQPGSRGGDMRLLASRRAGADALERIDARPDQRQFALLGGHDREVGAQRMRGREVRILGKRLVDRSLRVAEVAVGLLGREFVVLERRSALGRDRQAAYICQFHLDASSVG